MKEMLDDNNFEETNDSINNAFSLEEKAKLVKEYKKQYQIPIRPTAIYKKNPIGEWQMELRSLAADGSLKLPSDLISELISLDILPEDSFSGDISSSNNNLEEDIISDESNDVPDIDLSYINSPENIVDEEININSNDNKDTNTDIDIDLSNISNIENDTNEDYNSMPNILDYTDNFLEHSPRNNQKETVINNSEMNFSDEDMEKYNNIDFLDLNKKTKFLLSKVPGISGIIDLITLKQSGELAELLASTKGIGEKTAKEIISSVPNSYTDFSNNILNDIEKEEKKKQEKTFDIIDGIPVEAQNINLDIEPAKENINEETENDEVDPFDLSNIDLSGIDLSDIHEEVVKNDIKQEELENQNFDSKDIKTDDIENLAKENNINLDNIISELNDMDLNTSVEPDVESNEEDITNNDTIVTENDEIYSDNNIESDTHTNLETLDTDISSDLEPENDSSDILEEDLTSVDTTISDDDGVSLDNIAHIDLNDNIEPNTDTTEKILDNNLDSSSETEDNNTDISEEDLNSNDPIVPEDNEIASDDIEPETNTDNIDYNEGLNTQNVSEPIVETDYNLDNSYFDSKPLDENYITFNDNASDIDNNNSDYLNKFETDTIGSFSSPDEEYTSDTQEESSSAIENLKNLTSEIANKAGQIIKYNKNLPILQAYLYRINTIIQEDIISDEEKQEKLDAIFREMDAKIEKNNNDEKTLKQEINTFLDSF